ncbi:uncharacterized protein LOC106870158 [Octopus bimaculoides]|uniref:Uncharacterized protein n=1 Tax=Octopus bimaculoides TaxID=37653 RepID=A0A0L8HKE1_OCTBM|nr:uncharacterized protein LOC106870158 [Octopus bimaculoides]|eukprot:XP_014771644.1 PREDICTED: uncharacterized protein LOC106870158 [Octopus bimaculoides]
MCANVTVYGPFNSYPLQFDHDFKTQATDGNPGKIIEIKNPKADRLILTIVSESRHHLSPPACDHPSYRVSIEPIDSTREVVCHRKQDERSCTPAESESKCFQTPTNLTPRTTTDGAVTNQLSITAWISAGLLLAWRLA